MDDAREEVKSFLAYHLGYLTEINWPCGYVLSLAVVGDHALPMSVLWLGLGIVGHLRIKLDSQPLVGKTSSGSSLLREKTELGRAEELKSNCFSVIAEGQRYQSDQARTVFLFNSIGWWLYRGGYFQTLSSSFHGPIRHFRELIKVTTWRRQRERKNKKI